MILVFACNGDDGSVDAGTRDAGPPDVGPGRDAGPRRDAGRDSGEPDAAGFDPEWLRLTEVPDPENCVIEAARRPENVRPLPRFRSCGPGCRELVVDWEANENGARLFAGDGYHDGAHAYFVYARPYEPRPGALGSYLLVARDDGQHLVAFRVDWSTSCSLASVAITDTTFATAVNISNGRLRESRPIRARFDDPADEWATPAAPRAVINDHVVRTFTSETTTLYQGGVSARFHRYGPTGEVNEVGVGRDIASATVAGDTVFLSSFETSGWQLDLVREGETALETFFVPPDGADAWTEATDGVDFIWEQLVGDGPEYDSVEIWASRFTTVPSEFEPRRVMVHPVPAQSPHGVGFGRIWAGQVAGASFRVAVQALDGTDRRVWTPPPERSLYNEAMLGPEEMGLWIDFVRGDQGSEALRFYRFDALPVLE